MLNISFALSIDSIDCSTFPVYTYILTPIIAEHLDQRPTVSITYFVPDTRKDGGSYTTDTGVIKKIDMLKQNIVLYAEKGISDGRSILIDTIVEIDSAVFLGLEWE